MNQNKITNQILRDFSVENYENLFKGERNCWFLKNGKKRESASYLTDGEWSYKISWEGVPNEIWVSDGMGSAKIGEFLNKEDQEKVSTAIQKLNEKYLADSKVLAEKRKNELLSRVFA